MKTLPKLAKIGLFIALIVMLLQTHLLEAIFSLLFIGLIPGTNLAIPAGVMLIFYAAIGYIGVWLVIKREGPLFLAQAKHPVTVKSDRKSKHKSTTARPRAKSKKTTSKTRRKN